MTNVHVTDVRCSHLRPPTSRDDITNDKSARPLPQDIIWPQLYWNKYHTNNVTSGTIALLTFPSHSPLHRWKQFVQSECRIPLFQIYPLSLSFQLIVLDMKKYLSYTNIRYRRVSELWILINGSQPFPINIYTKPALYCEMRLVLACKGSAPLTHHIRLSEEACAGW